MAAVKPCMSSSQITYMSCTAKFGTNSEVGVWRSLKSSSHISATRSFSQSLKSGPVKSVKVVTRAMSGAAENTPLPGLPIDLRGQTSFFQKLCLSTQICNLFMSCCVFLCCDELAC